jgi:hypothetical protein
MEKHILNYSEFIGERLELVDWDEYAKLVAEAYEAAPEFDREAAKHWKALNESNQKLYKRLMSKVTVEFVTGEDPYPDQATMKREVERTGVLKIMTDHSEHPVFSKEENVIFRAVHDYITHILTDTPFGLKGELRAANVHMKLVPAEARPALFTEVVGQVAMFIVHNEFPAQKVAVLKGFDYTNLGKVEGYIVQNKRLQKK